MSFCAALAFPIEEKVVKEYQEADLYARAAIKGEYEYELVAKQAE